MATMETESVELVYVVIGALILGVILTTLIIEKDTFFALFDAKLATRHIRY